MDIITACRDIETGVNPQGDVIVARALNERLRTVSCVADAGGVATERTITVGRVLNAGRVVQKCKSPVGSVENADGVGKQRERSVGGVVFAGGVTQETPSASSRVSVCRVCKKRPGADRRVEVAFSIAQK